MLLLYVKNGLGLRDGDIRNELCTVSCTKNIWFFCDAEFGPICGAAVVLKRAF